MKKTCVLWTGGKDCCLALHMLSQDEYQVQSLLTFVPEDQNFKAHPLSLMSLQAGVLELPHWQRKLGNLPLIVISGTKMPENLNAEGQMEMRKLLGELQGELVKLSSNSKHIYADHSGHMVPFDRPDIIVQSIRDLLKELD